MSVHPLAPIHSLGDNERYLEKLREQINTSQGVVPFVGAGMSIPFGYPGWRYFLLQEARKARVEGEITARLDANDYEGAAAIAAGCTVL